MSHTWVPVTTQRMRMLVVAWAMVGIVASVRAGSDPSGQARALLVRLNQTEKLAMVHGQGTTPYVGNVPASPLVPPLRLEVGKVNNTQPLFLLLTTSARIVRHANARLSHLFVSLLSTNKHINIFPFLFSTALTFFFVGCRLTRRTAQME